MIAQLSIQRLRNLNKIELSASPAFNFIVGPNGSGKSSVLEAICILAHGKSFRTHLHPRVIQHGEDNFCIYASLFDGTRLGVEKSRSKGNRIHLNGEAIRTQAELAERLPLQLIHPDGYELITGSAKCRRQYLDWGTFHVEHQFFSWWQRAQRILNHRNVSLRQQASKAEIAAWNHEMVVMAELIDAARRDYFKQLLPQIESVVSQFLDIEVSFTYYRGWDAEQSLLNALQETEMRDRSLGYTQKGPHRADIKVRVGKLPAADALSRGQLKLLVCALRLAQGKDYQQRRQQSCLYLLDDLASELDVGKRHSLLQALVELQAQVFITSVEPEQLGDFCNIKDSRMFHVEQLRKKLEVVSEA